MRPDPYRVVDASGRVLCKLVSPYEEVVPDEKLLVKCGPVVVIMFREGVFHGVYSDLEFDICLVGLKRGDPAGCITRPKLTDKLPVVGKQIMREMQNADICESSLYNSWEITPTAPPSGLPATFNVTNKLAAVALANELMSAGKTFNVETTAGAIGLTWMFTVSTDVLSWITQRCNAVLHRDVTPLHGGP